MGEEGVSGGNGEVKAKDVGAVVNKQQKNATRRSEKFQRYAFNSMLVVSTTFIGGMVGYFTAINFVENATLETFTGPNQQKVF